MTSPARVVDLIDNALRLCEGSLARAAPAEHDEFDRVRRELRSWRADVTRQWPPDSRFLEQTRTLGVYAARELWDFDRPLAEAIIAARQAMKNA